MYIEFLKLCNNRDFAQIPISTLDRSARPRKSLKKKNARRRKPRRKSLLLNVEWRTKNAKSRKRRKNELSTSRKD